MVQGSGLCWKSESQPAHLLNGGSISPASTGALWGLDDGVATANSAQRLAYGREEGHWRSCPVLLQTRCSLSRAGQRSLLMAGGDSSADCTY